MLERDGCMRTVGVQLARAHRVLRRADWTDVMSGEFDLVTASYSLGEMPRASAPATWDATRGAVVVVEPGTPAGYRSVMEVRRHALGRGARVAAPCPHDDECPLALPHWCHFSQRLARTPLHRSLKNADLPWEDEKFSYVALARFAPKSATGRVVGRPRYRKHMVRLPICTNLDVGTRVIPASDEAYARARRASWGDGFA
jgi:ribosomal protein RSM22 (predicted rRNA methylase)